MKARGRPPLTRAKVLTYWRKHGPCPVAMVARATEVDRRQVQRILRRAGILPHYAGRSEPICEPA